VDASLAPSRRGFLGALAGGAVLVSSGGLPAAAAGAPGAGAVPTGPSVGTWAAVPTAVPASGVTTLTDQTVRQVVRTSIGGTTLRLRLTNEFGTSPLVIGEVRVARQAARGAQTDIRPGTDRPVTFGGRTSVRIPAGAPMVSDPVDLWLPARSDLVVSIHLPEATPVTTLHAFAYQENAVAAGNVTGAASVTPTATIGQWLFLSGVSVSTRRPSAASIVALGDSITNGFETTVNANRRWPDRLAERLQASGRRHLGVLNLGVAGNRLLHDPNPPAGNPAEAYAAFFGQSALRRFDRDVLAQPGVEHVVVLLGVNDLGHPGTSAPLSETVTAEEIIGAHAELVARAHEKGLRIYGGTITPFAGDTLGFFSPEKEAIRQEVTPGSAPRVSTTRSWTSTLPSATRRTRPACGPCTTAATTCTRTTRACSRWPARCRSVCSTDPPPSPRRAPGPRRDRGLVPSYAVSAGGARRWRRRRRAPRRGGPAGARSRPSSADAGRRRAPRSPGRPGPPRRRPG
jgi:lysophospholipase L1-like esterase